MPYFFLGSAVYLSIGWYLFMSLWAHDDGTNRLTNPDLLYAIFFFAYSFPLGIPAWPFTDSLLLPLLTALPNVVVMVMVAHRTVVSHSAT